MAKEERRTVLDENYVDVPPDLHARERATNFPLN